MSQWAVVTFLWLLIFAVPLLFAQDFGSKMQVVSISKQYGVIFLLFLLNRFLLMPQLFFKGRRVIYFVSLALLFTLTTSAIYRISGYPERSEALAERSDRRTQMQEQGQRQWQVQGQGQGQVQRRPSSGVSSSRQMAQQPAIPPYVNMTLLALLIIGFDFGLAISVRWLLSERREAEREREMSDVKLALLSHQISPHFFMNTLNNIHAFVDIDPEKAKQAIIDLSRLMSYLLYETNSQRVSLENEADFIRDYINLMRLRFEDRVEILYKIEGNLSGHTIPPLLFLNFVENAFKHGISYKDRSFVRVSLRCDDESVELRVENSAYARPSANSRSGFGIENSRGRLDMLYGDRYTLDIEERSEDGVDIFYVNLKIPL